jgi:[acyl-carrier-protein] S-malonyltransferase
VTGDAGTTNAAVGFPGQGVDPVDAARVLADHRDDELVELLVEHLRERDLGAGVPGADAFVDTRVAQPAIVVAGLLTASSAGDPPLAVGHSLGEITACAHAGVLTPSAALDLVGERARLGHGVHQARPGLMVALMRLDHDQVEWVRRMAVGQAGGILDVAVVNSPRQTVLTGDVATAEAAVEAAFAAGGVARRLGIGGAFHSPLLAPHVAAFRSAVLGAGVAPPRWPIVCSTGPTYSSGATPEEVADGLAAALVRPVDWPGAVGRAAALGATSLLDAGPGRTLVNLGKHLPALPVAGLRPE